MEALSRSRPLAQTRIKIQSNVFSGIDSFNDFTANFWNELVATFAGGDHFPRLLLPSSMLSQLSTASFSLTL